jgi:hypothetical protein
MQVLPLALATCTLNPKQNTHGIKVWLLINDQLSARPSVIELIQRPLPVSVSLDLKLVLLLVLVVRGWDGNSVHDGGDIL